MNDADLGENKGRSEVNPPVERKTGHATDGAPLAGAGDASQHAPVCAHCGRPLAVRNMPCLWCEARLGGVAVEDETEDTSLAAWVGAKPRAPEQLAWHERVLRVLEEEFLTPLREMTPGTYVVLLFVGVLACWLLIWWWGMRPVPIK